MKQKLGRLFEFSRLNEQGFDHVLLTTVFIVIIGIVGSAYYIYSHASPWTGTLEVASKTSGNCMEYDGGSTTNGTGIVLSPCDNQLDQKWMLQNAGTSSGKNAYTIETTASGVFECVDNWQASDTNGNFLKLSSCNTSDSSQKWVWSGVGNHQLMNPATGKCIDDYQGSTASGTPLLLFTCKSVSTPSQQWFEASGSAPNGSGSSPAPIVAIATGPVYINFATKLCLAQSGSIAVVQACNGGSNQQWREAISSQGLLELQNVSSNDFLSGNSSNTLATGVNVLPDSGMQYWTLQTNAGLMLSPYSGAPCMNATSSANGSGVTLQTCSGIANQQWLLPTTNGIAVTTGTYTIVGGRSNTAASPSDVNSVLQILKAFDPHYQCSKLSNPTDLSQCDKVFGQ